MTTTHGEPQDVHVGEVDGVPAVWADVPGPLTCGLMLRVGHADEPFAQAGVSHLVEHLALFGIAQPGDHANGFVDHQRTVFHTTGSPEDVVGFLDALTRQLRDLPLHRLEAERAVLRAEYGSRSPSTVQQLLLYRYGSHGFGIAGTTPAALHRLDAGRVQDWARARMSRADAVLMLSGPPPAGLRLHLPDPPGGSTPASPDPTATVLPRLPAWVPGERTGAALLSVVPRDEATALLEQVYGARLVERLRTEQAAAYSPSVDSQAADGRHSFLTVVTDLLPERADEVGAHVVTVLKELAGAPGGPGAVTDAEVVRARQVLRRMDDDPRSRFGEVTRASWSLLTGVPVTSAAERLAALDAVGPDDVARRAAQAAESALAWVPFDAGEATGWERAADCTEPMLLGDGVAHLEAPEVTNRLIVTPDAAGVRALDGSYVTVARERTAAVLAWPDGRRVLIGDDASRAVIEPTMWQRGAELVGVVDASWPADLVVAMPARDPEEVPQPTGAPASGAAPRRTSGPAPGPSGRRRPSASVRALAALALTLIALTVAVTASVMWGSGHGVLPIAVAIGVAVRWYLRHGASPAVQNPPTSSPTTSTAAAEPEDQRGIAAPEVAYRRPSSPS